MTAARTDAGRFGGPPRLGDGVALAGLGLVARLFVVLWAAGRFPPVEDGRYYHVLATRIAQGHGYTWLWPDGAVTAVAHYPVGYPGFLAALYAAFAFEPAVAMIANAVLGALAVLAVHRIASAGATRVGAGLAAAAIALHPALVMYTPALMTEGVTAALLAVAAWLALAAGRASGRKAWALLFGLALLLGVATLVRPQSVLLALPFGWLARPAGWRSRSVGMLVTVALALCVVAPWTARNCRVMGHCTFVSANGGWNLLIGATPGATGTFVPIEGPSVPEQCRTEFDEAKKDACFGSAARDLIAAAPLRWLALAPAKLAHTFDYAGAAGWYLHASNGAAFSHRAKLALGTVETVWQRALVALALAALVRIPGPRRRSRFAVALLAGAFLLTPAGWVSIVGAVAAGALLGRSLWRHPPAFLATTTLLVTALTHVVFFGAGRYGLPVFPLVAALAGCFLTPGDGPGDTASAEEERDRCP